jgi:tRNA:m4X modification enzyme
MVEKHVPICPRAKRRRLEEDQVHYRKDFNAGGHGDLRNTADNNNSTKPPTKEWVNRVALRVLKVHQRIFGGTTTSTTGDQPPTPPESITLQDLHKSIPLQDLSQQEMDAGLLEGVESYRIKSGGSRHLPQLASLIGHLRSIHVLPRIGESKPVDDDTNEANKTLPLVLLEMGAGRAIFGLTAAGVACAGGLPNVHLIMVERGASRSKADSVLRSLATKPPPTTMSTPQPTQQYLQLENVQFNRLVCDLAHVHLPTVLQDQQNKKVVVIAKHLCGAGTDLALKSIQSIQSNVSACVLATCCHGVCTWKDYVGRDFLIQAMEEEEDDDKADTEDNLTFGPAEFDLLRRWSAGTVSTHQKEHSITTSNTMKKESQEEEPDGEAEHSISSNKNDDESQGVVGIATVVGSLGLACGISGLGRACQRLIDHGRCEYLRHVIFAKNEQSAGVQKLCYYVPPDVTPQNAVLIAYNDDSS